MKKSFYSFLFLSSTLCAMEQIVPTNTLDVALIPTRQECKEQLKKSDDRWNSSDENTQLVTAFAEHGPFDSFNKHEFHFSDTKFDDNELLSWAVSKGKGPLVQILIGRGVLQAVGARSFERHVRNALEGLHDDVAVALLLANPSYKPEPKNDFDHFTLLQLAACTGSLNCARTLLEGNYGIKVDDTTKSVPATPLKLAAERKQNTGRIFFSEPYFTTGKRQMLNLLIKHGADPKVEVVTSHEWSMFGSAREDKSPFIDWCVSNKYDDCLASLVVAKKVFGIDKVKTFYGEQTLFEWASSEGSMPLIQAFIPPCIEKRSYQSDFSELLSTAGARGYKQVIDYVVTHPKTQKRKSTAQELVKVAVAKGWNLTTQRLVDHYGKDILFGTDDYYRPMGLLTAAAQSGKPYTARQLLDFGCNVLEPNAQGELPLYKSVEVKAQEVTDILLAAGAGTREAITNALGLAFSRYDTPAHTFEQLIAYAPDKTVVREICVQHTGKTPVEFAVDNGYHMLKVMLEAGFDPNDFTKKMPLKTAIGRNENDAKSVGLLLQYGADAEVTCQDGTTALHAAAYHGSVDALKLLFDAGLESTKNDEGVTPLSLAAAASSAEVVAFLIEKSNFNVSQEIVYTKSAENDYPEVNLTLLELAISENRHTVEVVCQLLLDRGADIERVNEWGETPVFWALRNNNAIALEWLVSKGVQLDVVNNKGETPLSLLANCKEGTQHEMLHAVLNGLSVRAGGLVTVNDALAHSRQWQLNSCSSPSEIALWKQSMKFDPFAKMRDLCGVELHKRNDNKLTLDERIQELEQKICPHGAYLYTKKRKDLFDCKDLEAVTQFIATGIDLSTYDVMHGATLLHWAAQHGHAQLLRDLLDNDGLKAVIDKETVHKYSALAEAQTVECAQLLLDHGASVTENVLYKMLYKKNNELCNLVWAHIPDELLKTLDIQQLYAGSVNNGNTVFAQKCRERGAQPKEGDIVNAVYQEHHDMVTLLVQQNVSLKNANESAKSNRWNPGQSLAGFAVEKKNLALLKTVVKTADASSLMAAARDGWHEGLEVLLESGLATSLGSQDNPLLSAIRAKSVPCCSLLIKHISVTFEHLKRAVEHPEILKVLLTKFTPEERDVEVLLGHAVWECQPESVKALLCLVKNLSSLDKKKRTYLHAVAEKADLFGVSERQERWSASWKDRVKNITWLQAWKVRMLEGKECVAGIEEPDEKVQKAADTLYALMTAPVYSSAQEHKKILFWLLQRRSDMTEESTRWWEKKDLEVCTAHKFAQKTANSSTFNDLLDPNKVKQWYAAIDREYAKRDAKK